MKYLISSVALVILSCLVLGVLKWKQRQRDSRLQAAIDLGRDVSDKLESYAAKTYTSLGTTTEEILGHENDEMKSHVLAALLWRIGQKSEKIGWSNLTDTERRLIAVYAMEGEVSNGGFDQYFFNHTGGDSDVALAGLKDIGATAAARLLELAMSQFPSGKPPTDYEERHEAMDKIEMTAKPIWDKCDNEYYDLEEDAYALCLNYAKKKRADIILP